MWHWLPLQAQVPEAGAASRLHIWAQHGLMEGEEGDSSLHWGVGRGRIYRPLASFSLPSGESTPRPMTPICTEKRHR